MHSQGIEPKTLAYGDGTLTERPGRALKLLMGTFVSKDKLTGAVNKRVWDWQISFILPQEETPRI